MRKPAPVFLERRSEPRMPASAPARVYFGPKLSLWADCVLKDMSAGGAKIHVAAIYTLPPRFVLVHMQDGIAFDAVLKWRRGDLAGMAFEQSHPLQTCDEPRLSAIRDAWVALQPGFAPRGPGMIG